MNPVSFLRRNGPVFATPTALIPQPAMLWILVTVVKPLLQLIFWRLCVEKCELYRSGMWVLIFRWAAVPKTNQILLYGISFLLNLRRFIESSL